MIITYNDIFQENFLSQRFHRKSPNHSFWFELNLTYVNRKVLHHKNNVGTKWQRRGP